MKRSKLLALSLLASWLVAANAAFAEASPDVWPVLKQSFFGNKPIERADFMKLEGPKRAESGAQVPITLTVEKSLNDADAIKKVYLFVDANPIPLTAIYSFTSLTGKAQIATRVRMEQDSFLHAVGETADGKLFMTELPIRAAGGCGGIVDGDDTAVRAAAGKIKMSVDTPVNKGEANAATFLIKHPMFTGLQRDLASGGYKPAFFINKVAFTYNDKPVMQADFGVGVSEDPYMKFFFIPDAHGILKVTADDNEGKSFSHQVDVSL